MTPLTTIYYFLSETKDVCGGDNFSASCRPTEVIVMESSELGRMEPGKCIPADRGNFGCRDDVLYLTDMWCSGRQSCEFYVPNKELMDAKANCVGWLVFLRATYVCIQGISSSLRKYLTGSEYVCSFVYFDENSCIPLYVY